MLEYNELTGTYDLIDSDGYNALNNMSLSALVAQLELLEEYEGDL